MKNFILLFFILFLLKINFSFSQQTKVRGKVVDAKTKEILPFVNISFIGTNIGTISDFNGEYFIETRAAGDTLIASFLGYKQKKFFIKKKHYQVINFELEETAFDLPPVVIVAGENPAHPLLDKIIKKRDENNPKKLENYKYEVYNKLEIDFNNVEKYKENKILKKIDFIFDFIDTCAITGKAYLPVFITETLSDYYYQKKPVKKKEVIKASRIAGSPDNNSISQFTGELYRDVNIYKNYINVFGKKFVSPIAKFGLMYYKYYLVDSAFLDDQWCYQMTFKPRRVQEQTFTGEMWIHDTTFAIKKVKVRISKDANINFVNEFLATVEYVRVDNKTWFSKKEELFVDFNLTDSTAGFFGRNSTSYKNIVINPKLEEDFFKERAKEISITVDGALEKDTAFWNKARHEKLTQKEENIYTLVDSVKKVPFVRNLLNIATIFVSGYYTKGYFEFGPYFTFYSFNPIEGNRFRFGGRTSEEFNRRTRFNGHLAYGTKDEKFKYGLGVVRIFSKRPRVSAGIYYKDDMEQIGQSQNAFMSDNILISLLRRNPNYKLSMVREFKGFLEKEWYQGFSNTIRLSYRKIFDSPKYVPFENKLKNLFFDDITSTEITFNMRYAYNEKFVYGQFSRISLGTEFPIINLNLTAGLKGVLESDYEYFKITMIYEHYLNVGTFGRLKYVAESGYLFGKLPYPLLRLHEGNETYAFDLSSFNMMNYYEFASDKYISLHLEHHFGGLFLNKFPLIRKLKWREIIYGKGVIGELDSKHRDVIDFPENLLNEVSKKPYYEAGVGIENIFKIIRIDAVWRLSYLDNPDIQKFGIRAKLQIRF